MIDEKTILEALKQVKSGEKRKFTQSIDLAFNLKEIDINKDGSKIDELIILPHGRGKPAKICAFIGPELREQAEKLCDLAIIADDFPKWEDRRKCKKLARQYQFFLAQANIMALVAKTFGRYLGPVRKMPNPKAGQVFPPKINLEPLVKNLKATVKAAIIKAPVIHVLAGNESMSDEQLADNILFVYNQLKSKLPRQQHNIANLVIKTSMGKGVKLT